MNTFPQTKETAFLRVKFASVDADAGVFEGYASVFGNIDSGGDIVEPGAFTHSLTTHKRAGTSPVMLWSHNQSAPIGKWLSLVEDSVGLLVRGQLNLKTQRGQDAQAHIADGDVSGLSIGYSIPQGGLKDDGSVQRILQADLHEISVVTLPMNSRARIRVGSKNDLEKLLTKSGLAKEAARRVAYGGWPALNGQDDTQIAALLKVVNQSTRRFKNGN